MNSTTKRLQLLLLLIVWSSLVFSQNIKIDSLTNFIHATKSDTSKVMALIALSYEYTNEETPTAIKLQDSAIQLASSKNFIKGLMVVYNAKGNTFNKIGKNNDALKNYFKALDYAVLEKNKKRIGKCYNNIGIIYDVMGFYDKALDYHLKSMAIKEELKDEKGIRNSMINIAIVYQNLKEYPKSLNYSQQVLVLAKKAGDTESEALTYNNIANIYMSKFNMDSAISYFNRTLIVYKQLDRTMDIVGIYNSLSQCYLYKKNNENALYYALSADSISKRIYFIGGVVKAKVQLGSIFLAQKNYKDAEKSFFEALSLANQNGIFDDFADCYNNLSTIYQQTNKPAKALEYYKKYTAIKDSLINDNKSKFISNIQENYEMDKKEQENKLLLAQNEVSETTIHQQKLVSYFISGGLVLALFLAFFIFRGYRQKQKANEIITFQKEEVEKQKSIVEEKSLIVEEKNKDILDSIHYAMRIQRAMLTSDSYLKKILPEHFVLYKPKDIVSGDFYWCIKHQNKTFIAVADCTGHGVPGAFMSLLGISFLNEIVIEKKITSPDKILNQLREEIIKALNPEDAIEESKDGMDIVLCCYDFVALHLSFAAANNSLYLIRDGQLSEYKPDKFPVGKFEEIQSSFTLQIIPLQKNDCIYTFTDGFADQFGGPLGKKYKYKQFKEQLIKNNALPFETQKKIIDTELENWKGSLEQVDDILMIGIKI